MAAPHPNPPLKVVVLISGGGTTLENLLNQMQAGQLSIDLRLVVSSSPQARGLAFAQQAQVPSAVVRREEHPSTEAFSAAIFDLCRAQSAELVVLGGFLKLLCIPPDFENRVINIHPSLIPAFCGRGYYGHHVHAAVLEFGAKVSGCTIHFVDNQYDHGPIILQRSVPVHEDDTPETLAARIFAAECEVYPEAIRCFAAGRLEVEGRRVRMREDKERGRGGEGERGR